MEVNCLNCKEKLAHYLCDVPARWRDEIVDAMCLALEADNVSTCADVLDCGYTAYLSSFTRSGSLIQITYTNEQKVVVTRTFSFDVLFNNSMDGLDPKCIATQEEWDAMTAIERIQAILDYDCECCSG